MAYGKYKDLAERTESDKVLRDKAFKTSSSPNYHGYQRGLVSMVYKFFDKTSAGSVAMLTNKSVPNQLQLSNELHQPITRKFKRRRVCSSLKTIFGVLI